MKGGEVGEEGWEGQGEKDSSVSLTWQVYYTSQWGETWRWRLGAKEDKGSRSMWQDGWCTVVFFCLCWGSQRFLQSKALETSWRSNSVTLTFINRYPSVKTVIRSHNRPSVMKHTDAGRYAWGWSAEGSHETEIRWLQGGGETVVRCTPRFRCRCFYKDTWTALTDTREKKRTTQKVPISYHHTTEKTR